MYNKQQVAIEIIAEDIADSILLLDIFSKDEIKKEIELGINIKYQIFVDSLKSIAERRYERALKEQHVYAGKNQKKYLEKGLEVSLAKANLKAINIEQHKLKNKSK
jgi:hypothetical protein